MRTPTSTKPSLELSQIRCARVANCFVISSFGSELICPCILALKKNFQYSLSLNLGPLGVLFDFTCLDFFVMRGTDSVEMQQYIEII